MKTSIVILIVSILTTPVTYAADLKRMHKNIQVQEQILDTIVKTDSVFALDHNTKGIYLEGLGALFTLGLDPVFGGINTFFGKMIIDIEDDSSNTAVRLYRDALKDITFEGGLALEENLALSEELALEELFYYPHGSQSAAREDTEEQIQRILTDFKNYLADYGPVMRLEDSEIVILRISFAENGDLDDRPLYQISATGKNLNRLQNGKLDTARFLDTITVTNLDSRTSTPSDIKIMRNILNTVLTEQLDSDFLWETVDDSSWEIYIPGYGAVFYNDISSDMDFLLHDVFHFSGGGSGIVIKDREQKGEDTVPDKKEQISNELQEILANYAPTIKSLKKGEKVVVALKVQNAQRGLTGMKILKLSYENIRNFSNRPEELKSKIEIVDI